MGNVTAGAEPLFQMSRPLKLLFLLSAGRRSADYVRAYNLAKELTHLGHRVTLMLVSERNRFQRMVTSENGMRVIETPGLFHQNLGPAWNRIYLGLGTGPLDIYQRVRQGLAGGYDVIQTFGHAPNVTIPVSVLLKRSGCAVVSDWCDIYHLPGGLHDVYHGRYEFIYRKIGFPFKKYHAHTELSLRRKADAVTAISAPLAEQAIQGGVGREKVFVVRGGADVEQVRPLPQAESRRQVGLPVDAKIVAFMGTFQGDLDLLIRSFQLVQEEIERAYLLVIGTPMPWPAEMAEALGVRDRYLEVGRCSEEMLPRFLAAADVLALPLKANLPNKTRWPNKIGEYMASGRPVVVNRVGDVAEMVEARGIGLVADTSAEDMAVQLKRLLADPVFADALGRKAREVVCSEHTWGHRARELEAVYRTVLERRSRAGGS